MQDQTRDILEQARFLAGDLAYNRDDISYPAAHMEALRFLRRVSQDHPDLEPIVRPMVEAAFKASTPAPRANLLGDLFGY
jgi:hypothetical protein